MKNNSITALLILGAALMAGNAAADASADTADPERGDASVAANAVGESAAAGSDGDNVVGVVKVKQTDAPREDGMVCRLETPTGSHYPRRVCRTAQQMADDRADAMNDIRTTDLRRRGAHSRLNSRGGLQGLKAPRGGR